MKDLVVYSFELSKKKHVKTYKPSIISKCSLGLSK